jgi:hypothetical protein
VLKPNKKMLFDAFVDHAARSREECEWYV